MTSPNYLACSLLALAIVVPFSPLAADDSAEVEHWLDRMARAVETLSYRGTLVHWRGDQLDTLRIIHRSDASGVRERLYSLNGKPREILRDGDQVRSLLADDQPVVVHSELGSRLLPHLPLSRLESARDAYRFHLRDRARVAGLQAQIVEILPLDAFRYGHRFWLEPQTGMLLQSALLDQSGQRVQQLTFVDIELGVRISDAELEPEIKPDVVLETRLNQSLPIPAKPAPGNGNLPDNASETGGAPIRVPDHFQLARRGRGESEDGVVFDHLLFSDGVASFSVYIEEATHREKESRLESLGSVHLYTRRFDERQITVVGEVPMATVRYVGRWLHRASVKNK